MSDQDQGLYGDSPGDKSGYEDDFIGDEDYTWDSGKPGGMGQVNIEEIIQECTERVLEILKRKNEW